MRKAIAILPVVSAIYPMITGATAPPTIVMMSREEVSLVFVPASLNANEKMGKHPTPMTIQLHPQCLLGIQSILRNWTFLIFKQV